MLPKMQEEVTLANKDTIEILLEELKREIAQYRVELAPLESREAFISRREAGGDWEDITGQEIATLKQMVLGLEQVINRYA